MSTERLTDYSHTNIVLLAAGSGSRFSIAGYGLPKPLLPIQGVPLGCMALRSVLLGERASDHSLFAVVQEEHCRNHNLDGAINKWFPDLCLVTLTAVLPGPVHSGLEAIRVADTDSPVIFVDCDQFFEQSGIVGRIIQSFKNGSSVAVGTMFATGRDFGYVTTNSGLQITHVVEQTQISSRALAGVYAFKSVEMFRSLAHCEVASSEKHETRFSDLLKRAIDDGEKVSEIPIEHHFACGTPLQYQNSLLLLSRSRSN